MQLSHINHLSILFLDCMGKHMQSLIFLINIYQSLIYKDEYNHTLRVRGIHTLMASMASTSICLLFSKGCAFKKITNIAAAALGSP